MTDQAQTPKKSQALSYEHSYDHLTDELRKLDLLIQLRIAKFRLRAQAVEKAPVSSQRYISHEEVDLLLRQDVFLETGGSELTDIRHQLQIRQNDINARVMKCMEQDVFLTLPRLAHLFALSPFELQTVVICLAPELHRRYDKLYAYLQDDITRKKPSVDLVLDLLCDTQADRWQCRTFFSDHAALFRFGIIHMTDDPQSPSGSSDLARFLKLDPRILNYLLGNNSIDGRLVDIAESYAPLPTLEEVAVHLSTKTEVLHLTQHHFSDQRTDRKPLVLYLHGPYGVGKKDLARGICGQLNCPLLYLDMARLDAHESDVETLMRLALREGLLLQAALYLDNVDALFETDGKAKATLKALAKLVREYGWLTFLAGEKRWSIKPVFESAVFRAVELPLPDVPLRKTVWEQAMGRLTSSADATWAEQLAHQFRLTPGQIRDAVEFASQRRTMRGEGEGVTLDDLYAASRSQSNQNLKELAIQIEPHYDWSDIVLPREKVAQLQEICAQVKHRYQVFGEWGFHRKLTHGVGLSVLFSGPPGTGKTMAAEVIAHELKLDLYKIDLSGVVSKYIGETEKNLAKIFDEAETSNAILFFDEADALFGKRTEVSDAHDRYANIETSYLLQKMEEYEGVVILATNLRDNMDEAFTRRIRFIVDFPFPDVERRMAIWKTHFPRQAPVSDEIDYEFLSKQFQISGGNIKNIVLNAAFFAAENGGVIGMEHILHGAKREFEKIGKLWQKPQLSANSH